MKGPVATEAQARRIAASWGGRSAIGIGGYTDPTTKVLVNRGWIVSTGKVGRYPSGCTYVEHSVSPEGMSALLGFLISERHKK